MIRATTIPTIPIRSALVRAFALVTVVVIPAVAQPSTQPAKPPVGHALPGDRVVFQLLGEGNGQRTKDTLVVDEHGRVPLPKIGLFDVSAVPIDALTDTLTARYSRFYRTPAIDLSVQRRITVDGEVARPDVYYADPSMTLRDLIARAGGLNSVADTHKLWLIRHGTRTSIPNWQSEDARVWSLESSDEIMVGRRNWLALNALNLVGSAAVVFSVLYSVTR